VALVHGRAGLEEFSDAAALEPEVQTLRRRVSVLPDPSLDKMAARVSAGAASISAPASRPMDDARLEAKFRSLAGKNAEPLLEMLRAMDASDPFSPP
jgi:2-methylcitrate dehydratase PrpD